MRTRRSATRLRPQPGAPRLAWTTRWFRKRALVYHALVLVIAPGCSLAADWQIHRAAEGNLLSYLYAFEWPLFAVAAVWGWWQLIHEDPAAVDARKVERARRAAHTGPFVPPPPSAPPGFEIGAARRRQLAEPGAGPAATLPVLLEGEDGSPVDPAELDEDAVLHSLSAYNAYLARLAAGRRAKTWRNPHGLPGGAQ